MIWEQHTLPLDPVPACPLNGDTLNTAHKDKIVHQIK